jgi:hypothetical protein
MAAQTVLRWSKLGVWERLFELAKPVRWPELGLVFMDGTITTVPETCRVLGISKSSYYAALREGRWQALEAAEAA